MVATLLTCPNCYAPLPPPAGSYVTCGYCGATAAIAHGVATRVREASAPRVQPAAAAPGTNPRERAIASFQAVMNQNGGVERAAMHAATELASGRSDGVAANEMAKGALGLA